MKLAQESDHAFRRGRALAEGMKDFATELRLIDVVDLIYYVRAENTAVLDDLVTSSAELAFKQGALRYGWAARADIGWGEAPSLCLDMEFCHAGVTVFFGLLLNNVRPAVDIYSILFDEIGDPEQNTQRLIAAIADARLA